MNKLLYFLPALILLSCHPKSNKSVKKKTPAELHTEYLQKALKSDNYKNEAATFQMVRSLLDSFKKGKRDSNQAIFVYNNSIATPATQIKTIAQLERELKKDTTYLKTIQLKSANEMASSDSLNNSKK